jgi:PAS domain S-box-containing protein
VIYAPYPISEDDKKFLIESGIDAILEPGSDEGIVELLSKFEQDASTFKRPPSTVDRVRLMSITKGMYDAAMKDMASRAKKLEEILENSSDVIYELDPYGRIVLISKAIERLTGYSRNELLGMSALDVTSPDSLEVVAEHISMLLSGKEDPPAVEVGVQAKNGKIIPAEMIVRPIRHEDTVVGILGIGRNVEERKRLEDNLRRAVNEKDFYLDLMAHDIQNFNQAIVGYLEMILATENLDPKLERFAKGAFRQVMQTAQLIAHLKKVAQVRQLSKETVERRDLKEVLTRGITNLQSRLDKNIVAITFDCQESYCPIMASDDIEDLLELLVSSLSRYSLSDILHLRISLSAEVVDGGRYWTVDICGNNLRISDSVVRCVMSQDFSGCQMIERPDLQLLVVRAIIETQGGTIEAKSLENGRGDRFVIRIPQA